MTRSAAGRFAGVALAVLAAALGSACATVPLSQTPEQLLADAATAARVQDALRRDPVLYDTHVDVAVVGGVVRLSGVLSEAEDFYEVRRVASIVPGVTRVVSNLQLVDRR